MLKYCLTAAALKAFSFSRPTRALYRGLGNARGNKRRATEPMPAYYFERVERMLRLSKALGLLRDGDRILEFGTGWLHWEAITARLFFDVGGVLYDVWDNRQMEGLKNYLKQLEPMIDRLDVDGTRKSRARKMIADIQGISEYGRLYDFLGFEYVVDPAGVLAPIQTGAFNLVVSGGVLEHIYARDAADIVSAISAVLKPGGWSVHSINIRDHLYQYDRAVSPKQYLQYADHTWRLCFENDVQYINRIQRSDWLQLFESAGLAFVEEDVDAVDVSGVTVARRYQHYSRVDLTCGGLRIVHRKPSRVQGGTPA
jgi:predicted SAM-dependent methyltransferase